MWEESKSIESKRERFEKIIYEQVHYKASDREIYGLNNTLNLIGILGYRYEGSILHRTEKI